MARPVAAQVEPRVLLCDRARRSKNCLSGEDSSSRAPPSGSGVARLSREAGAHASAGAGAGDGVGAGAGAAGRRVCCRSRSSASATPRRLGLTRGCSSLPVLTAAAERGREAACEAAGEPGNSVRTTTGALCSAAVGSSRRARRFPVVADVLGLGGVKTGDGAPSLAIKLGDKVGCKLSRQSACCFREGPSAVLGHAAKAPPRDSGALLCRADVALGASMGQRRTSRTVRRATGSLLLPWCYGCRSMSKPRSCVRVRRVAYSCTLTLDSMFENRIKCQIRGYFLGHYEPKLRRLNVRSGGTQHGIRGYFSKHYTRRPRP